jgi:hypothetical protein
MESLAITIRWDRQVSRIITMNIINLGIFTIANNNGKTVMTFRVPGA